MGNKSRFSDEANKERLLKKWQRRHETIARLHGVNKDEDRD